MDNHHVKCDVVPSLSHVKSSPNVSGNSNGSAVPSTSTSASPSPCPTLDPVLFFDLDNTVYSESSGIGQMMIERIHSYCVDVMGMSTEEANDLGSKYFRDYGLAIRGLLKHHQVDPVHYDSYVDGSLPLDSILSPNRALRAMIEALPPSYPKWIFTNAGITHAKRVLKLLDLEGLFNGIIYCHYADPNFVCKPDHAAFIKAMKIAGVQNSYQCVLIDDSRLNVEAALRMGWKAVLIDERQSEPVILNGVLTPATLTASLISVTSLGNGAPPSGKSIHCPSLRYLVDLPAVLPDILPKRRESLTPSSSSPSSSSSLNLPTLVTIPSSSS